MKIADHSPDGYLPGNCITLLETGMEYFPALVAALDIAKDEIHLETYIFAEDDTGHRVMDALIRAVQRGVRVHVLVDGFGARDFQHGIGARFLSAGGQIQVFRPEVAWLWPRRHRLRRLHRKLVVIDAHIAFVGGINIENDRTPATTSPRHDYAVRIEGPLLAPIHHAARHLWQLVHWAQLHRRPHPKTSLHPASPCGSTTAAFLIRDNLAHRRDIEESYLEAIRTARDEIWLACAYFLPRLRFRHALMEAAQRGVRVVLLLQGKIEYRLAHHATQALYGALIRSGVRIFEYHTSFLHAKVAVVDRYWATVGSSNIDPFSLLLAREANVVIRDTGFAHQLQESLNNAVSHGAHEIRLEDIQRQSFPARMASWLAYSAIRLMVGVAGVGISEDYR